MDFSLGNYIDLWNKYSINIKKDIFNTDTGLTMDKYGIGPSTTKKAIINTFLSEFFHQMRFDLIEQIYYDVLEYNEQLSQQDIYEFLCLKTIEMKGMPFDNYWIYMTLDNFYTTYKKDLAKGLEICLKSFEEIEQYLPYLKKNQNDYRGDKSLDEVGTLPNFVFCRDRLICRLIETKRFEEAEKFEQLMITRNYFPDKNGNERLNYTRIYRLNEHIEYLIKENQIDQAIIKCYALKDIDSINSSYFFKKIANYFFHFKNSVEALKYFIIAFELNPAIKGIDLKIVKLSKALSSNYQIDKYRIINDLEIKENNIKNTYELFNIANRYYSIQKYDKSIDILKRLINERGEENSLINSLSRVYKAIAKEKEKDQDYVGALLFYSSAYELIRNPKFPSKTLEIQKNIIVTAIEKLQNKIKLATSLSSDPAQR
jgi:tetratricopeptide (TPR) repeat protein